MDDIETFEPKRRFRWVLCGSLESFAVHRISSHFRNECGLVLDIDFQAFSKTDISLCPLGIVPWPILKFLSEDGLEIDSYTIECKAMEYMPFVELDYTSSDPVIQRVSLIDVRLAKRNHSESLEGQ